MWWLSGGACRRKGIAGVPEFSKRILAAATNEIQAVLSTCNNGAIITEARAWPVIGDEVVQVAQVFVVFHSIRGCCLLPAAKLQPGYQLNSGYHQLRAACGDFAILLIFQVIAKAWRKVT